MTERQSVEQLVSDLLFKLQSALEQIGRDQEPMKKRALDYVSQLRENFDKLTKVKCGNAKIFVALDNNQVNIESTVSIDIILVLCSSGGRYKASLRRETLVPLSEESFLECVHDTLAEDIASGRIGTEQLQLIEK
jgi:hypothetical protein